MPWEEDCIIFRDQSGVRTGDFLALSSVYDGDEGEPLQITGYVETPEPLTAGVYVLAELLAAGRVRQESACSRGNIQRWDLVLYRRLPG